MKPHRDFVRHTLESPWVDDGVIKVRIYLSCGHVIDQWMTEAKLEKLKAKPPRKLACEECRGKK